MGGQRGWGAPAAIDHERGGRGLFSPEDGGGVGEVDRCSVFNGGGRGGDEVIVVRVGGFDHVTKFDVSDVQGKCVTDY